MIEIINKYNNRNGGQDERTLGLNITNIKSLSFSTYNRKHYYA
jgi:hypothetical protein